MTFACVFPGQGSQSLGMMSALADAHPQVREAFQEASDALGLDLWNLVRHGPEETLNRTENTQPAMLAAGVAAWRVWRSSGGYDPMVMAGHSLGEYTALVCSGSLNYSDTVQLVAERGRLMQGAVPPGAGAMAAILGLDDAQVISLCERASQGQEVVEAANFNSPGQVVIAGSAAAVERAVALASEAGAKRSVKLPVSVPSHCQLMTQAAERLAERLAEASVAVPSIPVIHNVDGSQHNTPDGIRAALAAQLHRPVRWVDTIRAMSGKGISRVVEMGPGKVLSGLNKRIDKGLASACVQDPETLRQALDLVGA